MPGAFGLASRVPRSFLARSLADKKADRLLATATPTFRLPLVSPSLRCFLLCGSLSGRENLFPDSLVKSIETGSIGVFCERERRRDTEELARFLKTVPPPTLIARETSPTDEVASKIVLYSESRERHHPVQIDSSAVHPHCPISVSSPNLFLSGTMKC